MTWVLDQPKTTPTTVVDPPQPKRSVDWTKWALVALVVFFIARELRPPTPGPAPDDDTVVDVDGRYALIVYTDDMTQDQSAALGTEVAEAAESAGFEYRKFPADQKLESADEVWQLLRDAAADPPSMIWSVDGRAKTKPLTTKSDVIKTLEDAAK